MAHLKINYPSKGAVSAACQKQLFHNPVPLLILNYRN